MSTTPSISIKKTNIITLSVQEGIHKPYLYKGKAYKRNDTATIEVDYLELTRLILEGENTSFEELDSKKQSLHFSLLNEKLVSRLNLKEVSKDTLKTLELINKNGKFNNAAALLADKNEFPGLEVVKFGESINIILNRESINNESIISQYEKAISIYKKYYHYEKIKGSLRRKVEAIPQEAFREALANSLIHRTWDVNANISIFMYDDKIEIISPGGLPSGISEAEYLRSGISIFRNRIIGNIFLRLQMIEKLGTGIRRINEAYIDSKRKPAYELTDKSIKILLPVISDKNDLTDDEEIIYNLLKNRILSSSAIIAQCKFGKTKTIKLLNQLVARGYIVTIGNGKATQYAYPQYLHLTKIPR